MSSPSRRRLITGWTLAGVAAGVTLVVLFVALLTQSDWGRGRVLVVTLRTMAERVSGGELEVDRLDGNLLSGAWLYGLRIRGPDGLPFLAADSAYVDYHLRTLVGGDVVLQSVRLYSARASLRRLPGDSLWNYQRIFQDTTPERPGQRPGATLVEDLRLVDAQVTVRTPWEPDPEDAEPDTARLLIEQTPRGPMRTMVFAIDQGTISHLLTTKDERGGTFLRIDSASGTAMIWKQPTTVRRLEGRLSLRNDTLRFDADPIVLPASAFMARGLIRLGDEEPQMDITVRGDRLALRDFQWLYPPLPDSGTADLVLHIEDRPQGGRLFYAPEMRLRAPGTEVVGSFGMITGDTLRFVDVDLRAPRMSVPLVESMLPAGLPVEGLRIGSVEVRGTS